MFRASGGALYHWRALRHGRGWRSFKADLAQWLGEWTTSARDLVLIGPSAGHTLPTHWLKTFRRVDAYDLDPLAAPLFKLRHRGVRPTFHRVDVFWRNGVLDVAGVDDVLAAHPGAAVLFTNVIGQVLLEGTADEAAWLAYLSRLRRSLEGREWASYHDVYTHEDNQIIDHLTAGPWTERLARRRFEWRLTARSLHQIEGVRSVPGPTLPAAPGPPP